MEINPYDRCVSNKMVGGTQCTIPWYMNDNKLSHKNPAVISDIINKLQKQFGNLYVVRDNKHTFLGMSIEIKANIIQVDMVK